MTPHSSKSQPQFFLSHSKNNIQFTIFLLNFLIKKKHKNKKREYEHSLFFQFYSNFPTQSINYLYIRSCLNLNNNVLVKTTADN